VTGSGALVWQLDAMGYMDQPAGGWIGDHRAVGGIPSDSRDTDPRPETPYSELRRLPHRLLTRVSLRIELQGAMRGKPPLGPPPISLHLAMELEQRRPLRNLEPQPVPREHVLQRRRSVMVDLKEGHAVFVVERLEPGEMRASGVRPRTRKVAKAEGDAFLQQLGLVGSGKPYATASNGYDRAELFVLPHPLFGESPSSYPTIVMATSGLQSYWRLGDASGTSAVDEMRAATTYTSAMLGAPGLIGTSGPGRVALRHKKPHVRDRVRVRRHEQLHDRGRREAHDRRLDQPPRLLLGGHL
jgi:hypothetical protein